MLNLRIEGDKACVIGTLEFSTVLGVLQAGLDYVSKVNHVVFDFSQVTKADSAGVALMLEWWRLATKQNKPIQFLALPKKMQSLLQLSNLDRILQ